jgi:hypothetical protein
MNVHFPMEGKSVDMKDRFCEELERIFEQFPKYHMKILLDDFSAKVVQIFSNQQLGRRVHTKLLIIMESEY